MQEGHINSEYENPEQDTIDMQVSVFYSVYSHSVGFIGWFNAMDRGCFDGFRIL